MGTAKQNRKTRLDAVVALLIAAKGNWVAAFLLAEARGLQWQTRVYEGRHKLNLPIQQRSERINGQIHSYYRLILGAPTKTATPTNPTPPPQPTASQPELFPDAVAQRWCDPEEQRGRRR
jgi:hypothetical protein